MSGVITLPGATMDVTVITEVMACPSEVILQVMELVRVATKMTKRSRVEKNEKSNDHKGKGESAYEGRRSLSKNK